ncbi:MAG: Eco57I restriction-modification methylase domain-containing protein [Chloroflexi bacterium]|nr:Eco57I restriction-modification methylase domain-containing protein [Chloroflexota bacterium]
MSISAMNLHALRSVADGVALAQLLGYDAQALPIDGTAFGLPGEAVRLRSHANPSDGFGVLVATLETRPRSFKTLGRRLIDGFHDHPLAILGVRGPTADWAEAVVVRPRLIEGAAGSVSISRLTIDPTQPTAHDVAVVDSLAWDAADPTGSQTRIDDALDVERVTRRFYEQLAVHHTAILEAVRAAAAAHPGVSAGVDVGGGPDRVALRIVTQILFCYFLQRKGLLERRADWLSRQFREFTAAGRHGYYQQVLEPLFYEALSKPLAERATPWNEHPGIPFLNGGLFERTYVTTLDLPDEVFSTDGGLLGFLNGWTFTVSEEAADEHDVAVDPEMLGKVFENLVSDEEIRREGTVYTPRPVVQFMCREALVHHLQRAAGLTEEQARTVVTDDEALERLDPIDAAAMARQIDAAVVACRVLDPAVGSGAFPLGMLTEMVRLRRLAYQAIAHREPTAGELWNWKSHAVERCLFGVDINPGAVELCRLRMWLALLVEEETGDVHPLPNLEYRIVCADSLTDFVGGFEVQQTRAGALTIGLDLPDPTALVSLRERYFEQARPAQKAALREELAAEEDTVVEGIFARVVENARLQQRSTQEATRRLGAAATAGVAELRGAYGSRDRVFPLFVPAFQAPEVARAGGWDVVIMNPPYVGRKEVAQRLDARRIADLGLHYGRTYDLMIHFAFRALQFVRRGGVVSMIFNDSIFTSEDADELRRRILPDDAADLELLVTARSRCFEGRAVNGGVVVVAAQQPTRPSVRWVENHGRPTRDLAGASVAVEPTDDCYPIGRSELWVVPRADYLRLPHRPLFRPSRPARQLLGAFERTVAWRDFSRYSTGSGGARRQADWELISDTRALDRWKEAATGTGFYDRLRPGVDFILLGLVLEGGQGLATADDRRFLGAIDGTAEADEARENARRYAALVRGLPGPRALLERELTRGNLERALLTVADAYRPEDLGWPRSGLIRVAPLAAVRATRLTSGEIEDGITAGPTWVPFEKGDSSGDDGGAARWRRENPLVIDWSPEAVALLRRRARQTESYRKPYFRNEHLWGQGGLTWNTIASYLRARQVAEGAIFGHKTPLVRSTVVWLPPAALLAVMNAPLLDFALRTFLGSRLQIEVGHIRRLPVPVLTADQSRELDTLGRRAVGAKAARDRGEPGESLEALEAEVDRCVRELYGIAPDADLWVVR